VTTGCIITLIIIVISALTKNWKIAAIYALIIFIVVVVLFIKGVIKNFTIG